MTSRQSDAGFGYTRLQSITVGSGAAELVWDVLAGMKCTEGESVSCHIDAVFDRTVHLLVSVPNRSRSSFLLALGTRDIREGPLMINFDTPPGFSFRRLVGGRNEAVTVQSLDQVESSRGLQFHFGKRGILDVERKTVPTLPAAGGVYEHVPLGRFAAGSECLSAHLRLIDRFEAEGIEDGLNWFDTLYTYHGGSAAHELEAVAASVVNWISEVSVNRNLKCSRYDRKDCQAADSRLSVLDVIANFVGRGPGATPSGDDFLAGLLLPLQLVDNGAIAQQTSKLSRRITTLAVDESTTVSAALLAQVTRGRAAQPVMNCLKTLLTSKHNTEAMYRDAVALTKIGHTSGSDTLAGILTATTVVLPLLAAQHQ